MSDGRAQVSILKECRHPNIIFLKDVFVTEEFVYIVMEVMTARVPPAPWLGVVTWEMFLAAWCSEEMVR